jgi:hypothetical protein
MSCLALVRVRTMCAIAAIGALIAAGELTRTAAQQLPRDLPAPFANGVLGAGLEVCGTLAPATEAALRFRPRRVLQDNSPISFDQDPPLIAGDYRGAVTLRNLLVTGDVETMQFRPVGSDAIETWSRAGSTTVGTRMMSVFSPAWGRDRVGAAFAAQHVGFDMPYLYWGEVLPPGVAQGSGYGVYLRVMSDSVPQVTVVRAADDVQYSSSVVNIRADDFGSTQLLDDENDYGFATVTKRFYELFEDSYDSIGITTASTRLTGSTSAAFHQRIKNEVRGIGQPIFNNSAAYGSAGRLSGIEFYAGGTIASNRTLAHETAHRWSSGIDWARLLGITLAGHQPTAHEPLMSGGETRMGAVLEGTRRAENSADGWTIQKTPAPILFHPYTLYAMGLLGPDAVPETTFFDDQAQFNAASTATPAVGTAVAGATRTATAFGIVGMLGRRDGPVPSRWDQATVVVSSGRLLSPREMDYFTFYAQRTADPNASGVVSWNGHGSFDSATSRRIDLTHEVRPRDRDPIREPLPVDFPPFAPTDFGDIRPDAPIASVYDVGERMRLAGTLIATDRSDFDIALIRLNRDPGGTSDLIRGQSAIDASRRFDIALPVFTSAQRGQWRVEVFLFWPNSGSQFARSYHGVLTVR